MKEQQEEMQETIDKSTLRNVLVGAGGAMLPFIPFELLGMGGMAFVTGAVGGVVGYVYSDEITDFVQNRLPAMQNYNLEQAKRWLLQRPGGRQEETKSLVEGTLHPVKNDTTTYSEIGGGFCDAGPDDEILDLGQVLQSKLPFKIHVNRTFGEGLFVAGNQGSGKSVLLARTVEQFCKCKVTCIVFDLKPDFYTIAAKYPTAINAGHPDHASQFGGGYYSVTVDNVDQFVADVMTAGNQVIVNLPSYEEPDTQGEIIAAIIEALMRWGRELDEQLRFPCYVFLDEAHNFLPQQTDVAPISKETAEIVNKAFFKICNQGRAYGYTMGFFTQRIANIKKWVIANCQIKVIMKHGLDVDLKRCEDEISKKFATREDIEKLGKGQGIVIGWGMQPFFVQFKMRESHHPSSTPDIKRARAFQAKGGKVTTQVRSQASNNVPSEQPTKPAQQEITLTLEQLLAIQGQIPVRNTDDLPVQQEPIVRSPYYEQTGLHDYYQQRTQSSQYSTVPDLRESSRVDQTPTQVQRSEQATMQQPVSRLSPAKTTLEQRAALKVGEGHRYWSAGHNSVRKLQKASGWSDGFTRAVIKAMVNQGLIERQW